MEPLLCLGVGVGFSTVVLVMSTFLSIEPPFFDQSQTFEKGEEKKRLNLIVKNRLDTCYNYDKYG